MRCVCCDAELSDAEATAKLSGSFADMCRTCIRESGVEVKFRPDMEKKPREVLDDAGDFGEADDLEEW